MSISQETENVLRVDVEIVNKRGLHARAASRFVKLASEFSCQVKVIKEGLEVNGKSIMGLLMLIAEVGSKVTIECRGQDAQEALNGLGDLVRSGFSEE